MWIPTRAYVLIHAVKLEAQIFVNPATLTEKRAMKKEEEIFVKETFQSAAGQRYWALQKVRG